MSELNQSRLKNRYRCAAAEARLGTFCDVEPMSALPPKADMCGPTRDVRYGPKADISAISSQARPGVLYGSLSRATALPAFALFFFQGETAWLMLLHES